MKTKKSFYFDSSNNPIATSGYIYAPYQKVDPEFYMLQPKIEILQKKLFVFIFHNGVD